MSRIQALGFAIAVGVLAYRLGRKLADLREATPEAA
jgi:hypothetical protein